MSLELIAAALTITWKEYVFGMLKTLPAFIVLAGAIFVSYLQKLNIGSEMMYSVSRSFVQLSLVAFILDFIFKQKNIFFWMFIIWIFMIVLASHTAGKRARHVPWSPFIAGFSILAATSVTLTILIAIHALPLKPNYVIPLMGMMIGNAMTITGVTLKRLRDDIRLQKNMVETALALGATPRQAILPQIKRAIVIALSPALDNAKVVGLITLPGAMSGLIMGGSSPFQAIQVQLLVMNMMLGASTFSSIISTNLACRFLFTKTYQIVEKVLYAE